MSDFIISNDILPPVKQMRYARVFYFLQSGLFCMNIVAISFLHVKLFCILDIVKDVLNIWVFSFRCMNVGLIPAVAILMQGILTPSSHGLQTQEQRTGRTTHPPPQYFPSPRLCGIYTGSMECTSTSPSYCNCRKETNAHISVCAHAFFNFIY